MRRARGLWHDEIERVSDGFPGVVAKERLSPTVPQRITPVQSANMMASGASAISVASNAAVSISSHSAPDVAVVVKQIGKGYRSL